MNKLLRVLILLGIFLGLGISCVSAENVVSFNPQTVELHPGSSQNVQIAMNEVPTGLSGFNITISVLDPEIAEITAVSFPGWNAMPRNSKIPSRSVWIKAVDLNDQVVSGNTSVLLGTITLTGKKEGTTDLSIPKTTISDDNGSSINPVVNTGKINVTSAQKTPAITWSKPADITYGTALSITQLNAIASVPGTFTYNPVAGTVLSAGAKTMHVDFTPTDTANYNTASKDVTINVIKVIPTITWNNPANIINGTALGSTQLNAAASVPGTFVYTPAAGTELGVGAKVLHVDFTPKDAANYTTASKDVTINVTSIQKQTPAITWSKPADITYGTALSITQLNAIASVPGTFTYNPVAGTVLSAGAKTMHVDFTPTDTANYNTASKDVTINVLAKPITPLKAAIDATPTSGTAPLAVNFADKSTNATSIKWEFGDKSGISTNSKPSHTYATAGTYTVTLNAYGGTNSDVATRTITVTKPVTLKIKAIKADVTRGNAPLTVRFSYDVSGKPTSSIWTINKETIKGDTIGRVTHAFTKAGVYDVNLIVKDAYGHSNSMTKKGFITVLQRVKPPVASFIANPKYGQASLTVKFMDKSKNNPTSWKWDFGDRTPVSTLRNPSHVYKYPGKYTVTLTVKNAGGRDSEIIRSYIIVSKK